LLLKKGEYVHILPRFPITIENETVEIGSAAELAMALDVLQGQYDREVLVQLRSHLHQIILQAKDFQMVMKSLSSEDQIFLIETLGPGLAGILKEARYLREQLAMLADIRVEEALLSTLGGTGLRSVIVTMAELAEVLEWVYGQCDELALDLFGTDHIRRLCQDASDLGDLLYSLDHALQEKLAEQLGWEFCLGLVHSGRGLACLLRALPAASSERLLQHYTARQLRKIIGNAHEWADLYRRLEPAEADYIAKTLDLDLPERTSSHAQ
jgi:hypothetical protein